ncbi:MAG: hypothetical protein QF704_15070, partial [Anaerolineales bacterium]|nr:hypothetical protein [Anaerolineales bacterium]
ASAISDGLAGFTGNRSEESCVAYKAALQAAIDDGCDDDGVYQLEINNYDCDCIGLEADILVATTDFISDPTTTNCTTYKTTLQSAVDGSCDPSGAYQETINTLGDCSDPSASIDCVNLISGVVIGSQIYSTNPSNETCNAYKDSLMAAIIGGCDTDSILQVSFDSLDCESDIITPGDIETAIALVEDANAELEDVFSELYDSDEPDDIDGFLDLLDFSEAYSQYAEAQYLDPNNEDANFGVALTGLMQVTQDQAFKDMIDRWDNYFTNTTLFEVDTSNAGLLGRRGFGLPLNREGMRVPISPFVGAPLSMARMTLDDVPQFSELQDIVRNVFLPYVDSGIAALATVESNSDYIFSLTGDMQPDVDASSLEFDLTEVYA